MSAKLYKKDKENEFYFCLVLTENEHYIVEDMLKNICLKYDCKLKYYRKLKEGHMPTYREIKIVGKNIGHIKKYMSEQRLITERNPHKIYPGTGYKLI